MRWAKNVSYISNVMIGLKSYRVTCEEDDGFVVMIDGEYIKDMDRLPTYEEVREMIQELEDQDEFDEEEDYGIPGFIS